MADYSKLLDDIPASFEEFWGRLAKELGFDQLDEAAQMPLKAQVSQMFEDALFHAATKSLDQEDQDYVDAYLVMHPEVLDIDVYFIVASEKPQFLELLNAVLDELYERIVTLKNDISNVEGE